MKFLLMLVLLLPLVFGPGAVVMGLATGNLDLFLVGALVGGASWALLLRMSRDDVM